MEAKRSFWWCGFPLLGLARAPCGFPAVFATGAGLVWERVIDGKNIKRTPGNLRMVRASFRNF
jgi:hypothetical protein